MTRTAFAAPAAARPNRAIAFTRTPVGVPCRSLRRFGPHHTDPALGIVRRTATAAAPGGPCAVHMRVAGSDARRFRMAGLPALVHRPRPPAMGGAAEPAPAEQPCEVARVPALAAPGFIPA